jgi:hypothetical protein
MLRFPVQVIRKLMLLFDDRHFNPAGGLATVGQLFPFSE